MIILKRIKEPIFNINHLSKPIYKHEYEERYILSPNTQKIDKNKNKNHSLTNTRNLEQIGITIERLIRMKNNFRMLFNMLILLFSDLLSFFDICSI